MRIMTWNCGAGGFRWKAERIAPFRPDVLAVQEISAADNVVTFLGSAQPTFRDQAANPAYPKCRAIGMFSYTDTTLVPVDSADADYSFRLYEAQHRGVTFNVAAVWTVASDRREDSYMQAIAGLRRHDGWIRARPTVMLGDFNDNASYTPTAWPQLLELAAPLQLVSAYHEFYGEPFGAETRPTYYHGRKSSAPCHLDYCFVPRSWVGRIRSVEVAKYEDWHQLSDHVPLIVDLDLLHG